MGVLYPDGLNFQSSKPLNRLLITIHVIHVKPTPRYEYLSILSISKTGLTRPPPSDLRPDRALRHSGTSALGHYTSRNKYYRCQQCFLYVTQRWFTLCCTIPKVIDNNMNSDPPLCMFIVNVFLYVTHRLFTLHFTVPYSIDNNTVRVIYCFYTPWVI